MLDRKPRKLSMKLLYPPIVKVSDRVLDFPFLPNSTICLTNTKETKARTMLLIMISHRRKLPNLSQ